MKLSIYDVAREANVSIATVSRVLNNKPNVAPATRERIMEILREMQYQPSAIARGLVSNRTQTVGILTIDIRSPHYAATAYAMERELFKLGYSSILCNTGGGLENNIKYIHMLLDKGVSGIMCIGSVFRNTFQDTTVLSEFARIPFILSHCKLMADNAYSVIIDEVYGMELCVNHLVQKGHSKIMYVKDADSYSGNEKARGFLLAMQGAGILPDEAPVFSTQRGIEGGGLAIDNIIQSERPFSAIIFGDDITAVGGAKRLKQLGYSIPRDVAVIGYNNSTASLCFDPPLTTVDYKTDIMGKLTVTLLETILEGDQATKLLTVTPELIIREST